MMDTSVQDQDNEMSDEMLKRIIKYVFVFTLTIAIGGGISKYYLGLYAEFIPIQGEYGIRGVIDKGGRLFVMQKIIVINPPINTFCKNIIIEKYDRENPLTEEDIKFAENQLPKDTKLKEESFSARQLTRYDRTFYKESRETYQEWDGKDNPDKEGPDSFHKDDMIANVSWMQGESKKKYKMLDLESDSLIEQMFDLLFWKSTGLHWSM